MHNRILNIVATITLISMLGYGAWWTYNCFYGDWLDVVVESAPKVDKPPATYQVMPGDSLWAIAAKHYPGHHTGEIVGEIRKLNGMENSTVIHPYTTILKLPEVE